jgi:iron(III) transport system ATP-binding protein
VPAILASLVFMGHDASAFVRVGDATFEVLTQESLAVQPGQCVSVAARAPGVVLKG